MRIQVLVAAMNQIDHSLVSKMNITTDVIVGNQCDHNSIELIENDKQKIMYLNFAEKGVGLNRNNSLMRADADICLFADDDMVYVDDYEYTVKKAFDELPDADIIIFNLIEEKTTRYIISKIHKIHKFNYLRYGTARIAFRLSKIRSNAIYFNQCFGGGTQYSHGEDNLFLTECLNKGLRIYAYPKYIARLTDDRPSTWNLGINEKYIHDQGVLYKHISKKYWKLLCFQDALRHSKKYGKGIIETYKAMVK